MTLRRRLRPDRVHRGGRRVLTSAAPAVTAGERTAAGVAAFAVDWTPADSEQFGSRCTIASLRP